MLKQGRDLEHVDLASGSDKHHERRLLVGGRLHRRADAKELLRVVDGNTSSRAAMQTSPDRTSDPPRADRASLRTALATRPELASSKGAVALPAGLLLGSDSRERLAWALWLSPLPDERSSGAAVGEAVVRRHRARQLEHLAGAKAVARLTIANGPRLEPVPSSAPRGVFFIRPLGC